MSLIKKISFLLVFVFIIGSLFFNKTNKEKTIVLNNKQSETIIFFNNNILFNSASQNNVNIVVNNIVKIIKKIHLNILDIIEKIKNNIFYSPKQYVAEYKFFCCKIFLYKIIYPYHFFL